MRRKREECDERVGKRKEGEEGCDDKVRSGREIVREEKTEGLRRAREGACKAMGKGGPR